MLAIIPGSLLPSSSESATAFGRNDTGKQKWYVPSTAFLQFAGGQGMVSGGIAYDTWKKTETLFSVGYTPPAYGKTFNFNLKFFYSPFKVRIRPGIHFTPLNPGLYTSLYLAKDIPLTWSKSKYPAQYYGWPPALRIGPAFQSVLEIRLKKIIISPYLEASSNDLYLASIVGNGRSVSLIDILVLGSGVKFRLRMQTE